MAERRVSVFGGTGFLGRHIVRKLAASGWRVRVAARHPEKADFPGVEPDLLEAQTTDIRDEQSVAAAVAGTSAVVNAVALYVERGDLDFEAVHVDGAGRLARLSREAGAERLVHVSGIGSDPDSPSRLVRAKARGEEGVSSQFPGAAIVRPSVLFGRGDAFLANLEKATRAPVVPLFGSGDVKMQPAWVEDVAQAIARLATGGGQEVSAEPLEFGGAETLSYREAVEAVCDHLGRKRLLVPFPLDAWKVLVCAMAVLPEPPLTIDQLYLLACDNTVDPGHDGFAALGMEPRPMTALLAQCLPTS
ncbi:MAG: complex I NDUFA9 subunit family protein [Xanthomonadales bacterium]|nr:complex I NDUFA9 subunit family protein [Xanthomonadales bacterium]